MPVSSAKKKRSLLFRWQTKLYPEMLRFPDDDHSQQMLRQAFMGGLPRVVFYLRMFVPALALGITFPLVNQVVRKRLHLEMPFDTLTTMLFLFPLYWVLYAFPTRGRIRRCMRQYLQEMHIPICLGCGYDLRGQTEARCPECGREFDAELLTSNHERSRAAERN